MSEGRGRDRAWRAEADIGGGVGGDVVYTYVVSTLESGTRLRYYIWMRTMDAACLVSVTGEQGTGDGRAG